jgi:hypothetical protein
MGFGLVIGFIDDLQVVTTNNDYIIADFHLTKHFTWIFSVYFHQSSLFLSWQQIYNTGTIKVYYTRAHVKSHTLSLLRLTFNSSPTTAHGYILLTAAWSELCWIFYPLGMDHAQKTQLLYCCMATCWGSTWSLATVAAWTEREHHSYCCVFVSTYLLSWWLVECFSGSIA